MHVVLLYTQYDFYQELDAFGAVPVRQKKKTWLRPFFVGDRNDSRRQKKMKILWRKFCKSAMGPKTQKFRPTEIRNFCGRLFSSDHLQKFS